MVTLQERLSDDCQTTVRVRTAMQQQDLEGVIQTLAPDVVLRSPITDRLVFHGRDQVRDVMREVLPSVEQLCCYADIGDERTRALFYTATVRGQPLEEAVRVELNEHGEIAQLTIFYRPFPGLATFAAALAPRVAAAEHGRLRALLARLLILPLSVATRLGDRVVPWFA